MELAVALAVGIALGAGGVLWRLDTRSADRTRVARTPPAAMALRAAAEAEPLLASPDLREAPPADPWAAPVPKLPPKLPEGETPAPHDERAGLPLKRALAADSLSSVSHQLLGAWDDAPDSSAPGPHRVFILAVEPGTPESELEALLRDVRDRNRDARVLDVRVYESADALIGRASRTGDSPGREHLVAWVKRLDALGVDISRVRGRDLEP